jgi:FAD synthase
MCRAVEFRVEGIVVEGDRRGRELGFPTANILTDAVLPGDGVYAGFAQRANGTRYLSAISIGHRATFYAEGAPRLLEAFLIDFDGDLYGERLRVTVGDLVREQQRFATRDELIAQIQADVERVRAVVGLDELMGSD